MRQLLLIIAVALSAAVMGWQLNDYLSETPMQSAQGNTTVQVSVPQNPPKTLPPSIQGEETIPAVAAVTRSALQQIEALYEALYVAQNEDEAALKERLHSLITSHSGDLAAQQRWNELLALRQRLAVLDPNNAHHHYQLAELQLQLRLYDEALYSLYFILQDAVMGAKAQALEQRIKAQLRLAQGVTVPLTVAGAHHVVEASLQNQDLRLLLDTGASITTLTPNAARRLNIDYAQSQSIKLATAGGLVVAPLIEVSGFAVGDVKVEQLQVAVLPLFGAGDFDGLLGMNFLRQFANSIDQQAGLLYLGEKS